MNAAQKKRALLDEQGDAPAETGEKARVKIDGIWREVDLDDVKLPPGAGQEETAEEKAARDKAAAARDREKALEQTRKGKRSEENYRAF